jgi:hypothetical protein
MYNNMEIETLDLIKFLNSYHERKKLISRTIIDQHILTIGNNLITIKKMRILDYVRFINEFIDMLKPFREITKLNNPPDWDYKIPEYVKKDELKRAYLKLIMCYKYYLLNINNLPNNIKDIYGKNII